MSRPETVRVVGVDLSLASTGLADNLGRIERFKTKAIGQDWSSSLGRIRTISNAVIDFAEDADLVVVEGPSYGQRSQAGMHLRAGLHWMVLDRIAACVTQRVVIVPPSTRAMYATGRGNAGKDEVLAAVVKRYPSHGVDQNDVADAVILAAIGARLLDDPIEESLPATHLRAMTKLVSA